MSSTSEPEAPYWVLISILLSSVPITPPLARDLHRSAYDLYRRDGEVCPVECGLARGQLHNLRREAALGSISGPVFEARLETERGPGRVSFVLTRPGIELMAGATPSGAVN